jgi:hypothetical protein
MSLGIYTSGGDPLELGAVSGDVAVKVEALNANGEPVPFAMTLSGALPGGASVFQDQKNVLFTRESDTDQTVTVRLAGQGELTIPIVLPGGAIDKTAPTGRVNYIPSESGVRAYLSHSNTDLADNGVRVTGQDQDGRTLELKEDAEGYYVEFASNGSGYFMLVDKAGNIGTVALAVVDIDNTPPALGAEGWSGVVEASSNSASWQRDLERILTTPTNNPIKIFFSFNEQIARVEATAYDDKAEMNELLPVESYVSAVALGNTVTVEIRRNCQAKITVYDLRGNATVLWRPEDGPITVIDRDTPELEDGYPQTVFADNKITATYKFKNGKEVMLADGDSLAYQNSHVAEFAQNGQYTLTFVDKAGNVKSFYPAVTQIDELAPHIKMSMQCAGEGREIGGKDADGNAFYYTNRNVQIVLNVADDTAEGLTVTAARLGGGDIPVTVGQVILEGRDYTHHFTVEENGVYVITARDKWGNVNTVYSGVTLIDRDAPVITMNSAKAIQVERDSDVEAVKNEVLQGVTARDAQSGVNGGVTLTADMSDADLTTPGSYKATITATDRLGNMAVKTRTVNVLLGDLRMFTINGHPVEANEVFTTTASSITVGISHAGFGGEKITLYWAQGSKTAAQMKYATPFVGSEGFTAGAKGYYTVMAQSAERGMYLVYIYVY